MNLCYMLFLVPISCASSFTGYQLLSFQITFTQQNARDKTYTSRSLFKSKEFERSMDMITFSEKINELEFKKKKKNI